MNTENQTTTEDSIEAFTFGEPEAVLDKRDIVDYFEVGSNDKWYEPSVSMDTLAKLQNAAVHHSSPMQVKRNILVSMFVPTQWMSTLQFTIWAQEFIIFGNAYYRSIKSKSKTALSGDILPAKFTKRGIKEGEFYYVPSSDEEDQKHYTKDVFHLIEPDINQEIYGVPQYLAAVNSILLNESATLFRRRYYKNGSHAGYILYMTDAAQESGDVDALKKALKDSKGPGNFRNLFMYAPNGKKDGIQLIPVAEAAAKDEFGAIKNTSRDDMLGMHRVAPELMGIIPENTGGFGDPVKSTKVLLANEILPIQARMLELNTWLGIEVIKFKPYDISQLEASGKKKK